MGDIKGIRLRRPFSTIQMFGVVEKKYRTKKGAKKRLFAFVRTKEGFNLFEHEDTSVMIALNTSRKNRYLSFRDDGSFKLYP